MLRRGSLRLSWLDYRRRTAGLRIGKALAVLAAGACPVFGQALPSEPSGDLRPCIVSAASEQPVKGQVDPRVSQKEQSRPEGIAVERQAFDEREVLEVIETLEAAQGGKVKGSAGPLRRSPERFRVVLDDVTALIVGVHAREAAKRLEAGRHATGDARRWSEQRLQILQTCVSGRFEGRGGEPAYRQSLALVEKHRSKLESLVLGLGLGPGRGTPAEPPRSREAAQ